MAMASDIGPSNFCWVPIEYPDQFVRDGRSALGTMPYSPDNAWVVIGPNGIGLLHRSLQLPWNMSPDLSL